MSKEADDQALKEVMNLIRKPAKELGITQAQYLLKLVKSATTDGDQTKK